MYQSDNEVFETWRMSARGQPCYAVMILWMRKFSPILFTYISSTREASWGDLNLRRLVNKNLFSATELSTLLSSRGECNTLRSPPLWLFISQTTCWVRRAPQFTSSFMYFPGWASIATDWTRLRTFNTVFIFHIQEKLFSFWNQVLWFKNVSALYTAII